MSYINTSRWLLLVFLVISALWDICLYKIPNWLVVTELIIGFGFDPSLAFVARACLTMLVFSPLWKLRIIGGADVKLFACMCAVLGVLPFVRCFIYICLCAGTLGIIKLVFQSHLIPMAAPSLAGYIIFLLRS